MAGIFLSPDVEVAQPAPSLLREAPEGGAGTRRSEEVKYVLLIYGNPVVTLNRAIAVAMVRGPPAGLDLMEMAGDHAAARCCYQTVARRTTNLPRTALPRGTRRPVGRKRAELCLFDLDRPRGTTRKVDDVNDKPEEKSKPTHEQGAACVLDLADPERGDDDNEFQGCRHGAGVSFIVVDAPPGSGPRLHRHPYEEVFVVQEGSVTFTAGDETIEVKGGQVVVVPAGVPHKFVNSGAERLRQVDIHASDRFLTEWLED
jgi:mannose-6-phosphate isomerase-like protein (cupin superfamily)